MKKPVIRMATEEDAAALAALYAPYVRETAISFEYEAPDAAELARRINETLKKYPYLVAEENGTPVGYAYASAFGSRSAYNWTVETSIYVERGHKGRGIGGQLYAALEEYLARQNVMNLTAHISCTNQEDEHLNNASAAFHAHMGYREIGRFVKCGYKFGKWYDVVWMQKCLRDLPEKPAPFVPAGEMITIKTIK